MRFLAAAAETGEERSEKVTGVGVVVGLAVLLQF
jgi:hypothetical protein